ncbi:class I SAM-dependent methyltransferase [Boseongicola aestuarii]|uniref:Methyltransferase domain protein n=1 Tax=Boseongicola aestuarii TaxID=1470561 RepID=A0A238J5M5_9RHOB|nr:class I SAM-dependent methyltransferase [Boseongicola aestuarii]SMX25184.1 Methyltransferase domain protein [Boseongicola aestuarii]
MDRFEKDFRYDNERNVWSLKARTDVFTYSDGDNNENYLLSVMRNAASCEVMSNDLTRAMKDWPSTYHLHHQRCNLFRPIDSLTIGPILEIGAGCGALTRFLGEKGETVVALEGSPRRASIIGERCRDLPRVSVLNANFQDFHTDAKFKTITLIGVLEYARLYFQDGSAEDPIDQLLRRVSSMMAPDGVLIVAIENQLGLKYFAGFPEDHLGTPMSGIEEHYDDNSVVTFGRKELGRRLADAGLSEQRFAYPFPDYKFPEAILSEQALTGPHAEKYADLVAGCVVNDRQRPSRPSFRISKAIRPVVRNGLGPDMANSFLVMCSKTEGALKGTLESGAIYFGNGDRKKPYLKVVEFNEQKNGLYVTRRALTDIPPPSNASVTQVLEDELFVEGTNWGSKLQDVMLKRNWSLEDVEVWARVWFEAFKAKADIPSSTRLRADTEIDGVLMDAIPKNLIVDDSGVGHFFDLEWKAESKLELGYVLVRGLADSLASVESARKSKHSSDLTSLIGDLCAGLGVPLKRAEIYVQLEKEDKFQREVSYKPGVGSKLRLLRSHISHPNVNRLDKVLRNLKRSIYFFRHPF